MSVALTPASRRRLDIQGFERVDNAALAPVAPWLRGVPTTAVLA